MKVRLIFAIISNTLEEVAIVVIVLWGLPKMGIHIPIWGMIIIMIAWAAYSIFTFRIGTRALMRGDVIGLPDMIGCRGAVVSQLTPEGLVRIHGELWIAKSAGGEMKKGEQIIVVSQDRLKLVVQNSNAEILEATHNRNPD
ncbi:NfeD family protein [Chloroflexota bacterium]